MIVASFVVLVSSQVISYVKARGEASGFTPLHLGLGQGVALKQSLELNREAWEDFTNEDYTQLQNLLGKLLNRLDS